MNTKRFAQGVFAALIIPGAVYLIFALLRPDVFWRADVVYLLFIQSIESIILGWGMSFGMISGNMDLSVAAETILGTIVAAIAAKSFGIPGLVVGALATTMVVGWLKSLVLRVFVPTHWSSVLPIACCSAHWVRLLHRISHWLLRVRKQSLARHRGIFLLRLDWVH